MEIQYLKNLEANSRMWPSYSTNKPMTLAEIETLEELYNDNTPFPKVLREYLFLAGSYSWMLGGYMPSTQTYFREQLVIHNMVINRRFFALLTVDETVDLVFLDEGEDDPKFYMVEDYIARGLLYTTSITKNTNAITR
jgi:hypothetical protein